MADLPDHFVKFIQANPRVADAYKELGNSVAEGPLDTKSRALIKLGMSLGAGLEGAVHSQTRKALEAGASPEEVRHAVLQATTTLGFPRMMVGLAWVEDVLEAAKS